MPDQRVTMMAAALAIIAAPAPSSGHQTSVVAPDVEAAGGWQRLTRADVDAAYDFLSQNHPASALAARDPVFRAALIAARSKALKRLTLVRSMDGYSAVLREFANSMGDGHIVASPTYDRDTIGWAGIIAAKSGDNWVVARSDPSITGLPLDGATIMECDGRPIAELAKRVLAFRSVAGAKASQIMRAGRLLLDDGNPFLDRPTVCRFDKDGTPISVRLRWRQANRSELQNSYWKSVSGHAGGGVRAVGQGYWIGFEDLDPAAQPTIDQVTAQAAAIRNAAYVVVDLRGNGGGNDAYGRKLADALYGRAYVNTVLPSTIAGCPSVFRASPANIEAVRKAIASFKASGDTVGEREYTRGLTSMQAALARGEALTGSITCPAVARPSAASLGSPMHAPVLLLTDVACFSSCINVVADFRRLGATQVGQVTGEDTHYSEVRQIILPSGLATFSTMMAIMPDAPAKIGPYQPTTTYDGDMNDTRKLEIWVPTTLGFRSAGGG